MKTFIVSFSALKQNKVRTLMTMLGIIIGVAAVIIIGAAGEGIKFSIKTTLSNMGSNLIIITPVSNDPGGTRIQSDDLKSLTMKDVTAIEEQALYLKAVSPSSQATGQAINGALNWPTTIEGVNEHYLGIRNRSLIKGTMFSVNDVHTNAKVCLIGQTAAKHLFAPGIDPMGKVIRFEKVPFMIIGVLSPKGKNTFGQDQDDIIISPYTTVQKRITASVYLGGIYASAKSEALSEIATAEVISILKRSHRLTQLQNPDFEVLTQAEILQTLNTISTLLTALLIAIAGISLVVGGIGIMNIMYVTVIERTKEIGIRMAIGARGSDIRNQFLLEAIFICVGGGLIGIILGEAISLMVSLWLSWPPAINTAPMLVSFLFCNLIGIFSGYYPAQRAARLNPIDALRYE